LENSQLASTAALDHLQFEWMQEEGSTSLAPKTFGEDIMLAPPDILKLMKCSCFSQDPCRTRRCGCTRANIPCTVFCACEEGSLCCNELTLANLNLIIFMYTECHNILLYNKQIYSFLLICVYYHIYTYIYFLYCKNYILIILNMWVIITWVQHINISIYG
jgi:hypothetical protein